MKKRSLLIILIFAVLFSSLDKMNYVFAQENQTASNKMFSESQLNDITFGNNTYVAVGKEGTIKVSKDKNNWKDIDVGTKVYQR